MGFRKLLGHVTLANQLTFLRLVAAPLFVIAVLGGWFGTALGIFVAAAVTDLLDGLAARLLHQESALGAYLDPAADKILLTVAFVMLTAYPSLFQEIPMVSRIPVWLTILTISRDVFIVTIALMLYLAYGITRFRPSLWGKITTVVETLCVGLFLLFNALGRGHALLRVSVWVTLGFILFSGFHYMGRIIRMLRAEASRGPSRAG